MKLKINVWLFTDAILVQVHFECLGDFWMMQFYEAMMHKILYHSACATAYCSVHLCKVNGARAIQCSLSFHSLPYKGVLAWLV